MSRVTLSNHLILCHPLLFWPSVFPSIRVFFIESALCISWPKYWSFSFSNSPSSEHTGLISFRIDWLELLAVRKSLFQHHRLKASLLQCSAFFMVQFSHPYMTTGETIVLTMWTFVGKVMSLLFNTLFNFCHICHSFSSKELESVHFMATVTMLSDFEAQEKKICHCSTFNFFTLLFHVHQEAL